LSLDPGRETSLYQQLFDAIVERIRSGALAHGTRLPPTRTLADTLGAHRNTVVRAYRALEDAGFVTGTVGRGTFVQRPANLERIAPGGDLRTSGVGRGIAWSSLMSRQSGAEPLRRAERFVQQLAGKSAIHLSMMQPSEDLLPDQLFRRCLDHVLTTLGAKALGYAPRAGVTRLREQIALDLAHQGVSATAEDVLVTAGSQQALDLLARLLINPGDAVIVNTATYTGALSAFTLAGARLISVPSDDEGPELAVLERLAQSSAKALYLMPSCQNPTGLSLSTARRRAVVEWSRRSGIPLIEDDYVSDLHLDGTPLLPLRALDGDVIYVGTYSKKLIPALRVGYVVAPAACRPRLESLKQASDLGSPLIQHALAEFLERGYLRAHLARVLPEYRARRDAIEQGLAQSLPPGIGWKRPGAGLLLWVPLPAGVDPQAVFEAAREEGVLVMPSSMTRASDMTENGVRLTFCAEPAARLQEGARLFGKALKRVLKQSDRERVELGAAAAI
jgi:GntR family transcriptional regulator/MocR family aminotransferase